jgi:hypothetical protein
MYAHKWDEADDATSVAIGKAITARVASSITDPVGALRAKRS